VDALKGEGWRAAGFIVAWAAWRGRRWGVQKLEEEERQLGKTTPAIPETEWTEH
jgi:hypothetical protein